MATKPKIVTLIDEKDNTFTYPISTTTAIIYNDNMSMEDLLGHNKYSNDDLSITEMIASIDPDSIVSGALAPINKIIGNTDISNIDDGTITGAIDYIHDNYVTVTGTTYASEVLGNHDISNIGDSTIAGAIEYLNSLIPNFQTEIGYGGIRYWNEVWQVYVESLSEWRDILFEYVEDNVE